MFYGDDQLDRDVRAISAFNSWDELHASLKRGYHPTIHPDSSAEVRVRREIVRRGFDVFPPGIVKLAKLTEVQAMRVDDYIADAEETPHRQIRAMARGARVGRTVAYMPVTLARDLVLQLENEKDERMDLIRQSPDIMSDEQADFAERSVERSFDRLIYKVEKAIRNAR
jgi:hypothetical protein